MKRVMLISMAVAGLALPAHAAGPDLVSDFDVGSGTVIVKNTGTAPAGRSIVTVTCKRLRPPVAGGGGGCPEIPASFRMNYTNPAFPNGIFVNVGALAPGATFTHTLPFYRGLVFASGTYEFVSRADASLMVGETNEGNNQTVRTRVAP
ncbi:MAG: hypothetical protein KJS87_01310 [Alphaproteobacteria bacterium]|nr:hypothetical protein [Alphaproteobacteria bacterium]